MAYLQAGQRHLHIADARLEPTARRCAEQGDTSALRVWVTPTQRHGIWQMEPGVLPDVQGPETVVILGGQASVRIEPEGADYKLQAGDVFVIDVNETATWTVTETVRKFFVVNSEFHPQAGQ